MSVVIVERSMHDGWLSNTYLVADRPGGTGFLVDAGGPVGPLLEYVRAYDITLTHVLLTHHHHDHISELDQVRDQYPEVEILIHPLECELVAGVTGTIEQGENLQIGELEIRPIHTPGHTAGMLAFLVDGSDLFTGDTLFKGSVGGVRAPGHTTFADIKESIMGRLMELPGETVVHPGHTDSTTIADEWEHNQFIRIWRELDPEGTEPCKTLGEDATLVLLAPDYDGGHKAWVRWPDGSDDIVPGSMIE